MPNSEWDALINSSAARLYRLLTVTYQDFNVKRYQFTLVGGLNANTLTVGPNTTVPNFGAFRKLGRQVQGLGNGLQWAPVFRSDSLVEFDLLTAPILNTFYGNFIVQYMMYDNTIEIRPAQSAAGTYDLWYIPIYQKLVSDTDPIDGQWLSLNGIDEWIVVDVARKAAIKEESFDLAQLLAGEAQQMQADILRELKPRDQNQPAKIVDVKRARAGYGFGGFGGYGWW